MIELSKIKNKFAKEKISVGLDIGTKALRAVRLKFSKDAVELCGFKIDEILPDLTESLKKFKQFMSNDAARISFSGPSTIVRYAVFPKMNVLELKQALKFEAQKYIPFSVEEVNLDGQILKDDLADNKMLVLVAAIKKDAVRERLSVFEAAGIRVASVEIDSLELINAFNFNYSDDERLKSSAAALLNAGVYLSNLNIVEAGLPRLCRDIRIEAGRGNLADEMRTSFDYYESQSSSAVGRIFLSGTSNVDQAFSNNLSQSLGIPVENWDPFKKIKLPEGEEFKNINQVRDQLSVAVGLAF